LSSSDRLFCFRLPLRAVCVTILVYRDIALTRSGLINPLRAVFVVAALHSAEAVSLS
jgi:hypothetical protein